MQCEVAPARSSGRPWATLLAALLLAFAAAGCVGQRASPAAPPGPGAGSANPAAQFGSIAAGAPILVSATTLRLPAAPDGQVLSAVAADGDNLLLALAPAGNRFSPSAYESWNPRTGAVTPVPGWQSPAGATERVVGSWQDWVLFARSSAAPAFSTSLLLRNLKTGEARELAPDVDLGARNGGSQISADGRVVWVAGSSGPSGLHMYDIGTATNTTVPVGLGGLRRFSFQSGHLASVGGSQGQTPQVVVRDLAARATQTVKTGDVSALALSSDAHSLISIERAGNGPSSLLVRDLTNGTAAQVLSGAALGGGLTVSGPYVSWQPRSGAAVSAAGVYNVQTHELRLLQTPRGTVPYSAVILGNWFIWSQGAQVAGATPAGGLGGAVSRPGAATYVLKLGS